jgi:lactoylglutathione lyase
MALQGAGEETPMQNVKCLSHVALDVSDIEAALDFYVGKLGFQEMFRLEMKGWLAVNLRISDTQHLELFCGPAGTAAPADNHTRAPPFFFEVEDIGATLAELDACGVELMRPRSMGLDNNEQAWISDPDGNRMEFMQMAPDCLHQAARERLAKVRAAREPATSA